MCLYDKVEQSSYFRHFLRRYAELKPFLIDKIRKEKQAKEARDQNIAVTYNKMSAEWKRKLEKVLVDFLLFLLSFIQDYYDHHCDSTNCVMYFVGTD